MHASLTHRAAVALAGAAILAGGASQAFAHSAHTSAAGSATISIKLKGKGKKAEPYFTGPKTIQEGAKLTIVNTTSPKAIGPHTFSLVKPAKIPHGTKAINTCASDKGFSGVCLAIAKAHKVNLKTEKVGKPSVDVGKKGWSTSFGKKGDTWFTQAKGETQTRTVTAKAGTTLTYFCAVHPNMVGTIKVVK